MKPSWSSLDLSDIRLPYILTIYNGDVTSLLTFVDHCLETENAEFLPRDDYKEFLKLAKLILGEWRHHSTQKEIHLRDPAARSRRLCKVDIQGNLHPQAFFAATSVSRHPLVHELQIGEDEMLHPVYLESWFRLSSLFSAASNDLQLHQRPLKFRKVHKKLANVGMKVLQRHTWYLTQELVPLYLFNNTVPEDVRNKPTDKISIPQVVDLRIEKLALPTITPKTALLLPDYIGPRSTVLFTILDIHHTFVDDPEWRQRSEYMKVKIALKNLTHLNDSRETERALALATHFNGLITKDEESYQDSILLVEGHWKKFSLMKKSDLKQLY